MLPTLLVNLFIGYTVPMIDNAAHLGGLIAGCVLALLVGYKRPGASGPVALIWRGLQLAALALVVAGFGEVARHLGDARPNFNQPATRLVQTGGSNLAAYLAAISAGETAFDAALERGLPGPANDAAAQLNKTPPLDPQADALRDELKLLLVRARDYAELPDKERKTFNAQTRARRLQDDFVAWNNRFNKWLATEGSKKYGITLQNDPNDAPPAAAGGQGPQPPRGKQ
jgi:hypothetical protein